MNLRAIFHPQKWGRREAVKCAPSIEFDAAPAMLKMPARIFRDVASTFEDEHPHIHNFDHVGHYAGLTSRYDKGGHTGPFYVEIEKPDFDAFLESIDLDPKTVTDETIAAARHRLQMVGIFAPLYLVVTGTPSDPEDDAIPGAYMVEVDGGLQDGNAAGAALDHFHDERGIAVVEAFEIRVIAADGRVITQGDDYQERSHQGRARFIGEVGEADIPDAVRSALPHQLSVAP